MDGQRTEQLAACGVYADTGAAHTGHGRWPSLRRAIKQRDGERDRSSGRLERKSRHGDTP